MVFTALHELAERNSDPRARKYFLLESVWEPVIIVVVYLLIMHIIGPWMMKNRKPFNIRKYMMVYDIFQVGLNLYLTLQLFYAFYKVDKALTGICVNIDYTNSERGLRELNCAYLYFIIKVLDLADTLFFLLKKSYRQMTFLHIYHHAAMVMCSWVGAKYFAGGLGGWVCLLNSIIHIFMYAYYFAAAYNPSFKQLPFKKLLTQLQLLQFISLVYIYGTSFFTSCRYSKGLSLFITAQSLLFIYLFSDFYYKTYLKPKTEKTNKNQ